MFILTPVKLRSWDGRNMKVKRVLRFYFSADSLETAFDNLIMNNACKSVQPYSGEIIAEKIFALIEEKEELSRLYSYLDGVISGITVEDRCALESYALMRCGIKRLDEEKRREIKRAAMKFTRRARRLESFVWALRIINKYYSLL